MLWKSIPLLVNHASVTFVGEISDKVFRLFKIGHGQICCTRNRGNKFGITVIRILKLENSCCRSSASSFSDCLRENPVRHSFSDRVAGVVVSSNNPCNIDCAVSVNMLPGDIHLERIGDGLCRVLETKPARLIVDLVYRWDWAADKFKTDTLVILMEPECFHHSQMFCFVRVDGCTARSE